MTFPEYGNFDALALAELIRRKEVSAAELLAAACAPNKPAETLTLDEAIRRGQAALAD